MKKLFLVLSLVICAVIYADQETVYRSLTPAVTLLAATSTNATAGTVIAFDKPKSAIRIYLTASGIAATTNGSLIVKFSTANGSRGTTNDFDTASLSNIKLTMSTLGLGTNTIHDWFVGDGIKYLRVGQIENTFQGSVSNISLTISYPQ